MSRPPASDYVNIAAKGLYQLAEYQGEAENTAVANEESPVWIFGAGDQYSSIQEFSKKQRPAQHLRHLFQIPNHCQ
jgi:hypothetical protein